jgi:hypothetical protein
MQDLERRTTVWRRFLKELEISATWRGGIHLEPAQYGKK